MLENKDYELIPADADNDQAWNIRILTGEFNETVIRYGNLEIDGKEDLLKFNFTVIFAPSDYITIDNSELQEIAGKILVSIIEDSIRNETAIIDEKK